ncbi:DUF998 domain-containing protein [Micromonospora sp. WMMD1082]|uniref:DUF998 domain-containing protein n=1 Tax=Micromonospora sp. WMMD1082 TaxID=3016104 RepID=UPI00241745A8|nr:DUF998 domain-containing protein [Micromonospora sp. WMMD1082]MDG4797006.1 DUF998 domain-containing protein [Micromonospora sp. WMMD1082]
MTAPDRTTRRLLTCGVFGPPLFVIAFLVEGALRPGYSMLRQTVSELAAGPRGWQQIANFLVFGVLLLLFAAGLRRATRSVVVPALVALIAAALVVSGLFVTDPVHSAATSWHGTVHNAAAIPVFLGLPALCLVVAVLSLRRGSWGWAVYSTVTAVAMLATIQGLASDAYAGLFQRITIVLGWTWFTVLALRVRAGQSPMATSEVGRYRGR